MRIEKKGKLKTSHLFSPRTFGSSRELVARAVAGGGGAGAVGIRKDSRTRTGRLLLGEYLGLLLTSQPLLHGCLSYGVPHGADGQVRGVEEEATVLRSYEVGGAEILDGDVVKKQETVEEGFLLLQEERFGSVKGRIPGGNRQIYLYIYKIFTYLYR